MMENSRTNGRNNRELTFEERLRKYLETSNIDPCYDSDPHFIASESDRNPIKLYNHTREDTIIGESTRVLEATALNAHRGRF